MGGGGGEGGFPKTYVLKHSTNSRVHESHGHLNSGVSFSGNRRLTWCYLLTAGAPTLIFAISSTNKMDISLGNKDDSSRRILFLAKWYWAS